MINQQPYGSLPQPGQQPTPQIPTRSSGTSSGDKSSGSVGGLDSVEDMQRMIARINLLDDGELARLIEKGGPEAIFALNKVKENTELRAAAQPPGAQPGAPTSVKDDVLAEAEAGVASLPAANETMMMADSGIPRSVQPQGEVVNLAHGGLTHSKDEFTKIDGSEVPKATAKNEEEAAKTAKEEASYLDRAIDYVSENPLDAAALGLMAIPGIGWGASAAAKGIGAAARYGPKAWKALTSPAAKRAMGTQKIKDPASGVFGKTKDSFMAQKPFKTKADAELALKNMNLTGGQKIVKDGSKWKRTSTPESMKDSSGTVLRDSRGNTKYHKATTETGDNWVIVPSGANIAKSLATSGKVAAGVGATYMGGKYIGEGIAGLGAGDGTADSQTNNPTGEVDLTGAKVVGDPATKARTDLHTEMTDLYNDRKSRRNWEALAQAGFTMAGSKNPRFLGMAGEGGTAGLGYLTQQRDLDIKQDKADAAMFAANAKSPEKARDRLATMSMKFTDLLAEAAASKKAGGSEAEVALAEQLEIQIRLMQQTAAQADMSLDMTAVRKALARADQLDPAGIDRRAKEFLEQGNVPASITKTG